MYFKSIHEGLKGIKMSIVVQILILFGCNKCNKFEKPFGKPLVRFSVIIKRYFDKFQFK